MAEPGVIHVVGKITEEVYSFLGPATWALADCGLRQTVIHVADGDAVRHLGDISPRVALRPVRLSGGVRKWIPAFRAALSDEIAAAPIAAVHLHGVLPWIAAVWFARSQATAPPMYFSPHGSKSLHSMRLVGTPLYRLLARLAPDVVRRPIVTVQADAADLLEITGQVAELVECPVDPAFFAVRPVLPRTPMLVTGTSTPNAAAADQIAQLAVLLGEDIRNLGITWVGPLDAESSARLAAAGVRHVEHSSVAERAALLAGATVYIAPADGRGFPVRLAEAMAANCACIAWNTSFHQGIVVEGLTGLICKTQGQLVAALAMLLGNSALRFDLAGAARRAARDRFDPRGFRSSLVAAYNMPVSRVPVPSRTETVL